MVQMGTRVTSPGQDGDTSAACLQNLRAAVSGLVWLAGGEEARILLAAEPGESGTPGCWSATATIAHNSEFREQQVTRLVAARERRTPPEFPPIVHTDPDEYERFAVMTPAQAVQRNRSSTLGLIDELGSATAGDLLVPGRNAWLRGRLLWLQIVVRGFWHPLGHVGDYYLRHGQADRAIAMHEHVLATARYLRAPDPALGMASYSLACAHAVCGHDEPAVAALADAVALNDDLREPARREPDLAALRRRGRLGAVLQETTTTRSATAP